MRAGLIVERRVGNASGISPPNTPISRGIADSTDSPTTDSRLSVVGCRCFTGKRSNVASIQRRNHGETHRSSGPGGSTETALTQKLVREAVERYFEVLAEEIAQGEQVELYGSVVSRSPAKKDTVSCTPSDRAARASHAKPVFDCEAACGCLRRSANAATSSSKTGFRNV